MTVTILNRILVDMFNPDPSLEREPDCPEELWLQLDNCSGENKNAIVMAYCGLLVSLRIFKKVSLLILCKRPLRAVLLKFVLKFVLEFKCVGNYCIPSCGAYP